MGLPRLHYWLRTCLPVQVDIRDMSSIPGSGRSPGGGHGNSLQYLFLENPMDRGAWKAVVHRVTQSQTGLKQLSIHTCIHNIHTLSVQL